MEAKATAGPRRKSTAQRRPEIADAAMRILAEQGSRHLTAKTLAREVGITDGAVFRHFASMDAVVDAVIDRMEAILFEGFPPEADDPIDRLGLFFQRRVEVIEQNPSLSRLLLSDHLSQAAGPERGKRIEAFKQRSQRFVIDSLLEAKKKGRLAAEIQPEAGAVILLGSILSLAHAGPRLKTKTRIETLADRIWSAIEKMLRR